MESKSVDVSEQDSTKSLGTVVVMSRDLFFAMRIRSTLKGMQYAGKLTKDLETFTSDLLEGDDVVLGIVDFNQPVDWSALSSVLTSTIPLIAFGAHTDVDGFRAARTAGVTRVISNGSFSSTLPDLLLKYAQTK